MAQFQVTLSFNREDVNTVEEATAYVREIISEEMLTTGEPIEIVEVEIV
jgi:hypothetical protein